MPDFIKLLVVLLFTTGNTAIHAAELNRYGKMAEQMMDMMDAFSSAYQKKSGGGTNDGWMPQPPANTPGTDWLPGTSGFSPWSLGGMSMMPGLSPWGGNQIPWSQGMGQWGSQYMPWGQGEHSPPWRQWYPQAIPDPEQARPSAGGQMPGQTPLEGSWRGPSGEILMVRGYRFRIYLAKDRFKDGSLRVLGPNRLTMIDPERGVEREYEFALHQEKLALRDVQGNLLLFKRN